MDTTKSYIGRLISGEKVYLTTAMNPHIAIFGEPGSGKTTLMNLLEMYLAYTGNKVIVPSYSQTHNIQNVYAQFRNPFEILSNVIDVKTEGLPFSLWPTHNNSQEYKTFVDELSDEFFIEDDVGFVFSILCSTTELGAIQCAKLRSILEKAYPNRLAECNQFASIKDSLENCIESAKGKTSELKILYSLQNRLYDLLYRIKVCPEAEGKIQSGKINILSLDSYDAAIQSRVVDLLLGLIWCTAKSRSESAETNYVVLDEFQELNLRKGTPFYALLREGRKFHIGLIMATQEYHSFSVEQRTLINQAATKVFFRLSPNEAEATARTLSKNKTEQDKYKDILMHLPVGQCLVTGTLATHNQIFYGPVLVNCKI